MNDVKLSGLGWVQVPQLYYRGATCRGLIIPLLPSPIAQLAEHGAVNSGVPGSNPGGRARLFDF